MGGRNSRRIFKLLRLTKHHGTFTFCVRFYGSTLQGLAKRSIWRRKGCVCTRNGQSRSTPILLSARNWLATSVRPWNSTQNCSIPTSSKLPVSVPNQNFGEVVNPQKRRYRTFTSMLTEFFDADSRSPERGRLLQL